MDTSWPVAIRAAAFGIAASLAVVGALAGGMVRAAEAAHEPDAAGSDGSMAEYECVDTAERRECPDLDRRLRKGGSVILPRGVYRQCAMIRKPTDLDAAGSLFLGGVCRGKGTFVQNADFTLRNAECAEVRGDHGNEACIRRQRGITRLDHVHFRDSYNGVIGGTGEPLIVENSLLENLGGSPQSLGRAHGLYVKDGTLVIRNTTVRSGQWEGHLIKSGGRLIVIEDSLLDERGGNGSRVIDAFNGGEIVISGTQIHAAADDGNSNVIGFDFEGRNAHQAARITLERTRVDCAGGRLAAGRNSFERLDIHRDDESELVSCR